MVRFGGWSGVWRLQCPIGGAKGLPRGAFPGNYLVVLGGACSQNLEPGDWAVQLGSRSLTS